MASSAATAEQIPAVQDFWVRANDASLAGKTITLPPTDQAGVRYIVPRTLCFLTDTEFSEDRFIHALQAAVAGCMAELPFLAGRVVPESEGSPRIKVEFGDNPGAELRIKRLPHYNARELDAAHWPIHKLSFMDLVLVHRGMGHVNYTWAVQANILTGGVILMIHINHTCSDGTTNGLIQDCFVHHMSRSLNGQPSTLTGKFPPESQDRSLVYGTQPARPIELWQDWQHVKNARVPKPEPLTLTGWFLPAEKMAKLRTLPSDKSSTTRLSTAHTLAAVLWRTFTRARRLPADELTTMISPVQVRGKVQPPLHPNYCGNALAYGRAKVSVKELLARPLSDTVLHIDRSCKWWTPEAVREMWGSIENVADVTTIKPNMFRDFGTDFEVSNLMNMPFYKLDWGRGLCVRCIRFPNLTLCDGWVNVLPRYPDGGLEIVLHATRTTLANLVRDPEFTSNFQYRMCGDLSIEPLIRDAGVQVAPPRARL